MIRKTLSVTTLLVALCLCLGTSRTAQAQTNGSFYADATWLQSTSTCLFYGYGWPAGAYYYGKAWVVTPKGVFTGGCYLGTLNASTDTLNLTMFGSMNGVFGFASVTLVGNEQSPNKVTFKFLPTGVTASGLLPAHTLSIVD